MTCVLAVTLSEKEAAPGRLAEAPAVSRLHCIPLALAGAGHLDSHEAQELADLSSVCGLVSCTRLTR